MPGSEAEQIKIERAFARERQLKAYGRGTAAIVGGVPELEHRPRASGDIDVLSATRLNALLEAAGHLPPTTPGGPTTTRSVTGIARNPASGTPAAGVTLLRCTPSPSGAGTTTHSAAVDGDSPFCIPRPADDTGAARSGCRPVRST